MLLARLSVWKRTIQAGRNITGSHTRGITLLPRSLYGLCNPLSTLALQL
jgi:hypothetical protein